jgi:DNA-binding transcriptional MerR regulator
METYKIDEVSKVCGLTKRTIRYYEELGLLMPTERTEGGMRLYTQEHIDRLKQIISARDVLGFSLQEILDFVKIREQFEGHRHSFRASVDTQQKLHHLQEVERGLAQQLQMIDQKMETMAQFRREREELHQRIKDAIQNTQTTN